MSDIKDFATAIQDAGLPLGLEILTILAEMYKPQLDVMAVRFRRECSLGDTFAGGFEWRDTPQGYRWWKVNVREELRERGL